MLIRMRACARYALHTRFLFFFVVMLNSVRNCYRIIYCFAFGCILLLFLCLLYTCASFVLCYMQIDCYAYMNCIHFYFLYFSVHFTYIGMHSVTSGYVIPSQRLLAESPNCNLNFLAPYQPLQSSYRLAASAPGTVHRSQITEIFRPILIHNPLSSSHIVNRLYPTTYPTTLEVNSSFYSFSMKYH